MGTRVALAKDWLTQLEGGKKKSLENQAVGRPGFLWSLAAWQRKAWSLQIEMRSREHSVAVDLWPPQTGHAAWTDWEESPSSSPSPWQSRCKAPAWESVDYSQHTCQEALHAFQVFCLVQHFLVDMASSLRRTRVLFPQHSQLAHWSRNTNTAGFSALRVMGGWECCLEVTASLTPCHQFALVAGPFGNWQLLPRSVALPWHSEEGRKGHFLDPGRGLDIPQARWLCLSIIIKV